MNTQRHRILELTFKHQNLFLARLKDLMSDEKTSLDKRTFNKLSTYKLYRKMLDNKCILCRKCNKPIKLGTLIYSKKSQLVRRIYHVDCFKWY